MALSDFAQWDGLYTNRLYANRGDTLRKVNEHSHRFGLEAVKGKRLYDEIETILACPEIVMKRGVANQIGDAVERKLSEKRWALRAAVHPEFKLDINASKDRVGLTIQTGNIARAFYDLMKFQVMYLHDRIDAAVLVLPTKGAAAALNSNVANFDRVTNEIRLFQHVITVPALLIAFDE